MYFNGEGLRAIFQLKPRHTSLVTWVNRSGYPQGNNSGQDPNGNCNATASSSSAGPRYLGAVSPQLEHLANILQ